MKYYQLKVSWEPNIIGVNNGIYQIQVDKNLEHNPDYTSFITTFRKNANELLSTSEDIFDLDIPVIKAKLLKKAKVTDLMGYSPYYKFLDYVYSEKYLRILDAFNIYNYKAFEVSIENVTEKYFFIFYPVIKLREIIYKESVLYTGHKVSNNVKEFYPKSFDEYINIRTQYPLINFSKLSVSKEHFGRDIISTQGTGTKFYSERLIDFLLDCGVTGLEIKYDNSVELAFY